MKKHHIYLFILNIFFCSTIVKGNKESQVQTKKITDRNNNTSWESITNQEKPEEIDTEKEALEGTFFSMNKMYFSSSISFARDDFDSGHEWLDINLHIGKTFLHDTSVQLALELNLGTLQAIKSKENEFKENSNKGIYNLRINSLLFKKINSIEPYIGAGYGITSSLYKKTNDIDYTFSAKIGVNFITSFIPIIFGLNNEIISFQSLKKNIFTIGINFKYEMS